MATELPITSGYYSLRHLPISHQRCSNCYPTAVEQPALSQAQLLFTPGLHQLLTTGGVTHANRGAHVMAYIPYYVNGSGLYQIVRSTTKVDGADTITYTDVLLGTIGGTAPVSMADNGTQLVVLVPGQWAYVWDGTTLTPVTDTDFVANGLPQVVEYVDGYFVFTTDSKKFIISSLNNGLEYSALDFTSAEADPDAIVAPVVLDNALYILGSETTEGFQNTPSVGRTPFVRTGLVLDIGCRARFSVVKIAGAFFMIGAGVNEAPAIWKFQGSAYTKISTNAVDILLSTFTEIEISGAVGSAYGADGAYFVMFRLPTTTLCYDVTTEKWHERNSVFNDVSGPWRVASLVSAYGQILVGDTVDGRIGVLSLDHLDEYGTGIIRLFTTQPFANLGNEIAVAMLELTMESGAGNSDVEDPVVSMAASRDGKTWSNERARKIGKVGEYSQRVVWYRNGTFDRFVVFLFRMSEPIKSAFIKLEFE